VHESILPGLDLQFQKADVLLERNNAGPGGVVSLLHEFAPVLAGIIDVYIMCGCEGEIFVAWKPWILMDDCF